MPTQINGLPAHVLLLHVLVVLGPLAALFTILSAVWPRARRRIGIVGPVTAAIVVVFTPITTHAGEWLEHRLEQQGGENKAIEKHANLGDTFLWFALGLFVVSVAVWWVGRLADRTAGQPGDGSTAPADGGAGGGTATLTRPAATRTLPTWVTAVVAVVAIVVSVLVVVQIYRIGDSGAHAAWDYVSKLK